jgi:hypothetical protein
MVVALMGPFLPLYHGKVAVLPPQRGDEEVVGMSLSRVLR